ncbi:rod shape-determining protein MreD [Psychrobacter sp. I-STPA6b]|uniref:rod shape-determining protein MreD n=1 Tax=Psychrobacter sp. I-STPA6b TaxID=2585718 RepID=UPI001D0CAB55|nr:rod shape-determining protein MreD [Psychrobacter sp. I-STPA6b]
MGKSSLAPSSVSTILAIVVSFIIASAINVYPFSTSTVSMRPMALIMVLIFWLIFQPRYVGVFVAFIIGLSADLLLDTRLGQQAFSAVIVALVIKLSSIYLRQLSLTMAWLLACFGLFIFQLVLWLLQYIGQNIFASSSAVSMLVSMITWPVVYLSLQRFIR